MNNEQTIKLKEAVEAIKSAKTNEEKIQANREAIKILAEVFEPEAKEFVASIKTKPVTTQNQYGEYYRILGSFSGLYRIAFARALVLNGGNAQGIKSAMEVITG